MPEDNSLLVQMYSLKPLARELRLTFELPTDPYSEDAEDIKVASEYLKALTIFFIRDEVHSRAVLIQPNDRDETPIYERESFKAFKSLVDLDDEVFTVLPWARPTQEKIRKEGDDRAWLLFNQERFVSRLNESQIEAI